MKTHGMLMIPAAVLVSCFVLFSSIPVPCATAGEPVTLTVPARKIIMVKTDVFVQKGDTVEIGASGVWSLDGKTFFGPDGTAEDADGTFRLSSAKQGVLLGKVGIGGQVFDVGSRFSGTLDQAGPLFLGINDLKKPIAYSNNQGELTAVVTLSQTAGSAGGRYRIRFLEDQMRVKVGKTEKPVSLQEIPGKKFQVTGSEVILSPDVMEKIRELPFLADVRIDKRNIFISNARDSGDPEKKGAYFPKERKFLLAKVKEGSLENQGNLKLVYFTAVGGQFDSSGSSASLSGEISMSIIVGGKGGAAGITLFLPYEGMSDAGAKPESTRSKGKKMRIERRTR
ncbi:hypothetical protein ACFL4G_00535 [Thermodesulfobacteriota bacterium]